MAREYIPKTQYFNKTRVQKAIKDLLAEAKEDRDMAVEAYTYFKDRLADEEGVQDNDARARMVDCLKVAQSARNNSIKLLSMVNKSLEEIATTKAKGTVSTQNPLFN